MSKNIDQIFVANPVTTNLSTDLLHVGRSPYGPGDDAAITFANFSAQFGAPYTAAALTKADDTNVTLTLGGTPATALLHAASITAGWAGQLAVGRGGTGNSTFTAFSVICAGTTATGAFQNVTGVGILNQVLVSQGAGALPQWGSVPGVTPAALTKTDDTNVTMTLGGTPATALLQATSMTLGWTGQLAVSRGGTGLASVTAHDLMVGNGTSPLTLLSPSATSGIPLVSQGASADPAYSTAVVAGGGTGNTTFTAYSVICAGTTATGAFQDVSGVGTSGDVLTSNGAGALPTWQPSSGGGVTPAQVQKFQFNYSADSGIDGTAYIGAYTPAITSYTDGMIFILHPNNLNTINNPTFDAGAGALPILQVDGEHIGFNDIGPFGNAIFMYSFSSNAFQLLNPSSSESVAYKQATNYFNYGFDSGTTNAYVSSNNSFTDLTGAVSGQLLVAGTLVFLPVANSNTGASTFDYCGTGAKAITAIDGSPIVTGEMFAGGTSILVYDGTNWQLLNPSASGASPTAVQTFAYNVSTDTGGSTAYIGTYSPPVTAYTDGMIFILEAANTNTINNPTFDAGAGPLAISQPSIPSSPTGLIALGDIVQNSPAIFSYNAVLGNFILLNPATSLSLATLQAQNYFNFALDSGTANNYVAENTSFTTGSLDISGGALVFLKALNANFAASVFDYCGSGNIPIVTLNGSPLTGGEILANGIYILAEDVGGGQWQLLNPSSIKSSQVLGTQTNDNAAAGFLGEFMSSIIVSGSAVTFPSNAVTDLTPLSLTAGDWDVWANINFATLGTAPTEVTAWTSLSSATLPDPSTFNSASVGTIPSNIGIDAPYQRVSLGSTTTVFVSGLLSNTSGDGTACGAIYARRAR